LVYDIAISSRLRAAAGDVWARALTAAGVNDELRPFVRMTFPAGTDDLLEGLVLGRRLCRSWILLGGVLPVDYDDVTMVALEPGRRFLERSTMLTQRVWEHERLIEVDAAGCRLTDRVRFEPRLALLGPAYRAIFAATFRWRHRRLRARWGAA